MDNSIISDGISRYPEIVAIAVLVLGVTGGRLAGSAIGWFLDTLGRRMARHTTSSTVAISPAFTRFSRALVFWIVVVFAVTLALRLLGVGELSVALDAVMAFIPKLLVGTAIIGAGHLLGLLSRNLMIRMNPVAAQGALAPRLAHGAIFVVALVMGLQHMGVDITFLTQLVLVLVAFVTGGMALAFALGARQHVANLVARAELDRFSVGERIRIGEDEGTILDIHRTGIELATAEGIASIPAARFATDRVLRLVEDRDDE